MNTPKITRWNLDPAHSSAEFAVRHMMIATVRGHFGDISGTMELNEEDPAASKVDVTIDVSSIDTRQEQRDTHLRSADFFDVQNFPTMRFVSKRVDGNPSGAFKIIGDLTIRGATNEIVLDAESTGLVKDPWGNTRTGFAAKGKLNRSDFGLTWNQVLEAGGFAVSNEVKLAIDAEFVQATAEAAEAA
jgi:polyisoprenoid-binding protein YceI